MTIRAKLASQLTLAAMAAARPRTAVGKTSPWISQPVPPTPMANEVMKKENPTITITVSGTPVSHAVAMAATSMKIAMPANPPSASLRRPSRSM